MNKGKVLLKKAAFYLTVFALVYSISAAESFGQDVDVDEDRAEAIELINQNKYLDALPILEKIMLSYPNDAELWAEFGIAIMSNSVILDTAEERKLEQARGVKALQRAKQLGATNNRALNLLDDFESADGSDNFQSANPEVEKALREGESYFGRADYDNAYRSYERAYMLDPQNYEAVVFMGDCFYAQKKYKESEPWFAKAVAIDPDREMAYRFWGDALLYQEKYSEALAKFINAVIAEPYSRRTWDGLQNWAEMTENEMGYVDIVPPGNEQNGIIEIKERLLKSDDGTRSWLVYPETRKRQAEKRKKAAEAPTFAEEVTAWKNVSAAFRKDLKAGKIKYPDPHLVNLLRIEDDGMLETYILLIRPYDHFGEEYIEYRKKNRTGINRFISKYIMTQEN